MYGRHLTKAAALAAGGLLLLTSCSDGSDDSAADVATLVSADGVGDAADAATRTDEAAEELSADEAALAFSQCMRDEGLDFPDLTIDAEDNIDLRSAFQTVDQGDENFAEAQQVCGEVLQQAGFGGGRRAAAESPEVQDALLEFSACVRDAGYDVGDLTIGGQGAPGQPGQAGAGEDGAAADGGGQQGQARAGLGNRNDRFAQQLGLDADDPEVQATIEGCMAIVDEAFTAAGVAQPQTGG